jgi:hypothetical protein
MDYLTILVLLLVPSSKYHRSAYCKTLGHFFWAFCLILFLGLTPDFGQPLEDSSNHIHPLTKPSLMPIPLIKTAEVQTPVPPKNKTKNC